MKKPLLGLLALLVAGCDYPSPIAPETPAVDTAEATDTPPTAPPDTLSPVPEPQPALPPPYPLSPGPSEALPSAHPPAPIEPGTRQRRRMDVDQLDRAFRDALGGTTWTLTSYAGQVSQFELLAETLGRPDFIDTTVEDLEATTLFAKFLGDASRKACRDRLDADLEAHEAGAETAVLFGSLSPSASMGTDSSPIEAQISALLLRFHGRELHAGDDGFSEWRWLFQSVEQLTGEPLEAWRALCVTLINHPDFFTY